MRSKIWREYLNTKALESKPVSIAKQKAEAYLNSYWTDSVN